LGSVILLYFASRVVYSVVTVPTTLGMSAHRHRRVDPQRSGRSRRFVKWLFLFVATAIVIDAMVGDRGLIAMQRARQEYRELAAAISRQRAENAALREEIRRLNDDPSAIEEIARRELGLIRPGEKVFIVRDLPSPKP
jgi:cell division protein FtsB